MRLEIAWHVPRARGASGRLKRLAAGLGSRLGCEGRGVALLVTSDSEIASLNRRFRGKAAPTDVLSFPSGEEGPGSHLGDLAISLERTRVQAGDHGHGALEELEVLFLHGVLHLLGHDHETDRGQMRRLERRLARELFGDVRGLIDLAEARPTGETRRGAEPVSGSRTVGAARSRPRGRAPRG